MKDFFKADGSVNDDGGIDWFRFSDGSQMAASALASSLAAPKTGTSTSSTTLYGTTR